MKKAMLACLLIALCFSFSAFAESADFVMSAETLQDKLDNCPYYFYLLDIRDKKQYNDAHIPHAYSVPLADLHDTMKQVLYSRFSYMAIDVAVYGDTAEDEEKAVWILEDLGFTSVYRLNTLESWSGRLVSQHDERRILGYWDTTDIHGAAVDQTILRGHKVTMVHVWATYWTPCDHDLSTLARLNREYGGDDFQVVSLVSDVLDASLSVVDEKVALAREIVREVEADFPHLIPSHDLFWSIIGQLDAIPTTFFVDETGMLIGRSVIGALDYAEWAGIVEETIEGVR